MDLKDFEWKDNNNVAIFFEGDIVMGITILDIKHFVDFLKDKKLKFYFITDDKENPKIIINKDRIRYIYFKEE